MFEAECLKPLLCVMDFQSPCINDTTRSRLWSCRAMDFHHRCRRPGPTRESGLHVTEHDRVALNIDSVFCSSYASNSKDASASAGVAALCIWGKLPLGELVHLCYDVLESRVLDVSRSGPTTGACLSLRKRVVGHMVSFYCECYFRV